MSQGESKDAQGFEVEYFPSLIESPTRMGVPSQMAWGICGAVFGFVLLTHQFVFVIAALIAIKGLSVAIVKSGDEHIAYFYFNCVKRSRTRFWV